MNLKFARVDSGKKFEEWKEFASTFGHDTDRPHMPLVTVSGDNGMFGYWSTLNFPIVMPAFHPEKTSPRQFKDMVEAISNAHVISTIGAPQHPNGTCYVALEDDPAIDKGIIRKLGFEEMNLHLWRKV